jgi:hypothetical protein
MKIFVVYYTQQTKRGAKEKSVEIKSTSRARAFCLASQMLPRHSNMGNVYRKNSDNHKLVQAGLL